MPQFPKIDHCIVCEDIRPELGNKITINGFLGITPAVEIIVPSLVQPIKVMFLFLASGGQGRVVLTGRLLDSNQAVLGHGEITVDINPEAPRSIIGLGFVTLFHEGTCAIQLHYNGQLKHESLFVVRQGQAANVLVQ